MRHLLFASLFVTMIASGAQGVSLSVSPDKFTYVIGETITLTVTGDDTGGGSYSGIFGRLDYSGALVNNGTRSQVVLGGPSGKWTGGVLTSGDNGVQAFSWAFNQVTLTPQEATNLPGTLSTVTLIAQSIGIVNVNWHTDNSVGEGLDFFGLTDAPGTGFCIVNEAGSVCPFVPEPTTAALLGMGLVALAAMRRRGTSR